MATNGDEGGGIDTYNITVLSASGTKYDDGDLSPLICNYCSKILCNVHQLLGCGHRYCEYCLFKYVAIGSNQKCLKGDCCTEIKEGDVRPDKACLRELKKLMAECNGCKWKGQLLTAEAHLSQCGEVLVLCKFGCNERVVRKELEEHYNVCQFRTVLCEFCNNEVKLKFKEEHYGGCGLYPIMCKVCNMKVARDKLKDHQSNSCPENVVSCNIRGCDFKGKIVQMSTHYKIHLSELFKILGELNKQFNVSAKRKEKTLKSINELQTQATYYVQQMEKIHKSLQLVIDLTAQAKEIREEIETATSKRIESDSGVKDGSILSEKEEEELRSLGSRIVRVEQELMIMRPGVEDVQKTTQSFHSQIVNYMGVAQTVRESISKHTVAMDEVKLRQDILDVKMVKGVFYWKIPEVGRRHREAKDRRTLSLYSPPFHTSPHGYRMCIRTYLNGDGSGKDIYISVFFVLMKSEHDDLLTWPFRRPVTFELVSQSAKGKSHSETFMPDEISPSFQKPTSEMNVASGFPKFTKQSVLRDPVFVKDDSIFIRCKVDVSGLQTE